MGAIWLAANAHRSLKILAIAVVESMVHCPIFQIYLCAPTTLQFSPNSSLTNLFC